MTKDSAACTDSGTCTGVSAYTQTISSDALFIFANTENLIGGYELSATAVLSNGVTALKSHSIGYFEFSKYDIMCVIFFSSTWSTDNNNMIYFFLNYDILSVQRSIQINIHLCIA